MACKPKKVARPAWEEEEEEDDEEDQNEYVPKSRASMFGVAPPPGETSTQAVERRASFVRRMDENPERLWDKALELGEVDLEAFKAGAGQALEEVILATMDDVISGRFNWTKPLP